VVSGVVIICLLTLRGVGMDGTRHVAAPKPAKDVKPAGGSTGEPAGE